MPFGAILPIVGSLLGGALSNKGASDRQEDAQSFSAQQFATRYQTTMADMKAAGLNPGLAYGGISGSAPTSSAAGASGFPDLGSVYNQYVQNKQQGQLQSAQVANIEADTANKGAQADLLRAQAAANWGTADQAQAQTGLIGANVRKIMAEIPLLNEQTLNAKEQGIVLSRTATMLQEQAKLMEAQGKTQDDIQAQLRATVGKLAVDTALGKLDLDAANQFSNLSREYNQLRPIIDLIRGVLRR